MICSFAARPAPVGTSHACHDEPWSALDAAATVVEAVAVQVQCAPDATAVRDMHRDWSYQALWTCVEETAQRLRDAGVQPGDRVLCVVGRDVSTVIALLAIWHVDAVYVPVKDDYPVARVADIVSETGAALQLRGGCAVSSGGADASVQIERLSTATDTPTFGDGLVTRDVGRTDEKHAALAYVIYTSGSTGKPKGVAVGHAALRNLIVDHIRAFDITSTDRVLQFSSPAFDASLFQMLMPLCSGASLVLADDATLADVTRLLERVASTCVTVLSLPPAYLARFERRPLPASVRLLNTGGDAPVVADARHYAAHCTYLSTYGPTEATICCAYHEVDPARDYPEGIPLGRPVSNMCLAALDDDLRAVPPGVAGQLFVSGVGLAQGYLGDPALTAHAFVVLPAAVPGGAPAPGTARWYRTGDLVRETGGELFFVGRADRQVKLNGYRIELAEIERALERHPAVTRSLVERVFDNNGRARSLHAYLQGDGSVSTERVRASLNVWLPAYMMPATLSWVTRFPLTPNGKIDAQALMALRRAAAVDAGDRRGGHPRNTADAPLSAELPLSPFHRQLAGIWQRALGATDTSLRSHFFEQGGDSLMAMRVAADVCAAFGCSASVVDVLRAPVFEDFAAILEARLQSAHERPDGVADDAPVGAALQSSGDASSDVFALTPAQRRLWTLQQVEPASSTYHLGQAFVLRGELDVPCLVRAFDAVLRRHQALNVHIVERRRLACQQIAAADAPRAALVVRDADIADGHAISDAHGTRDAGAAEALARELQHAAVHASAPFDLERGPLWRAELVRLGADRHLLLIAVHHLICDGVSLGILLRDLGNAYRALANALAPSWRHAAVDYPQLVAAQANRLQQRLPILTAFWKTRVDGMPVPLALPMDFTRPAQRNSKGTTLRFALDAELTARVARAAAWHGVSRFTFVLGVLNVLLHRYTEQEDLVLGVPVTERDSAAFDEAVGMFVNTVVVRTRIVPTMQFDALLTALADECAAVYAHGDYPFELLVEQADSVPDPAHHPLFNVMAAWQRADDLAFSLDGVSVERHAPFEQGSKFDLSFDFVETGQAGGATLQVLIEYSDALFLPARIERLFVHWRTLLASALDAPEQSVARLAMLPADELAQLQGFQAPRFAEPERSGLDGFADAVREAPQRTAIVYRNREWCYAEIGDRVEALAARIAQHTADHHNALVGVLVERSERFFIAMLAVWRAGHAYVPLDPRHPDPRLRQIVDASQCALVIADPGLATRVTSTCATLPYDDTPCAAAHISVPLPLEHERLAYCYFTSGSTGQPKGVLVNQRSVANAVEMWRRDYRLSQPRVLQLAGHAFDVALGDLCRSLLIGGTLVIADAVERADPKSIVGLLDAQQIDVCEITPAVARLLTGWFSGRPAPTGLRLLVVGSDVWTLEEYAALRARLAPHTRLVGSYGTTEATVDSTLYESPDAAVGACGADGERVPLGRPMSNVDVLICDKAGNPMPIGVPGELCLAGPAVAVGYLGWPSPDGERFVADTRRAGARMFRTRDRAVWRADGMIAFLGRDDDQIKVRGYRIDRIEIEQALRAVSGVGEAVVAVHATSGRLMAFVTSSPTAPAVPRADALRTALTGQLPFYAVPDSITVLERMPLNVNGKVAVKQLEAMEHPPRAVDEPASDATLLPRQALLAGLWREVLREPATIGPASSFFGLGGDSLRAVSLVIAAGRADATLTLADIYRYPSLEDMALRLVPGNGGAAALVVPLAGDVVRRRYAADAEDIYPASYMQGAMLDWSSRSPHSYHNQSRWRLQAPLLNATVMRHVVLAMITRYPALRTAFVRDSADVTGYAQLVLPPASVPVESEDLKALDAAAQDQRIAARLHADRAVPFTVEAPPQPMSRVLLFERAPGDVELVWSQHHALDDGWSHTRIEACMLSTISKLIGQGNVPREPVNHGYREVVALDRDHAASVPLLDFWAVRVRALPRAQTAGLQASSPNKQIVALAGDTMALLRQRAAALGISTKSLFVAAFHNALCEVRASASPVIGIVMNGRSARLSDPLGTVGLCWNVVPFYHRAPWLSAQRAFDELADIEPHAGLPLTVIERLAGRGDLLDACLNFTDFPREHAACAQQGAVVVAARGNDGHFHFPVTLTVALQGNTTSVVVFEFDGCHFAPAEQQALRECLLRGLQR